eukprot:CAMPEP_0119338540 /NCGR_PEP_ID=MMETSP1333-20130426/96324_1 /TAXON_ID=418940 /ORGANISM="Scyphosphaera apsteinii, Strain RCC1455" /LENGTH=247 /DNA_ID=CAMNT_0007349853 /DNA_START=47 /DNA_END=790 /DNA_ORIENTATION=-
MMSSTADLDSTKPRINRGVVASAAEKQAYARNDENQSIHALPNKAVRGSWDRIVSMGKGEIFERRSSSALFSVMSPNTLRQQRLCGGGGTQLKMKDAIDGEVNEVNKMVLSKDLSTELDSKLNGQTDSSVIKEEINAGNHVATGLMSNARGITGKRAREEDGGDVEVAIPSDQPPCQILRIGQQLEDLKHLKQKGVMSKDQYLSLRTAILEEFPRLERLRQLRKIEHEGLATKAECDAKRAEILKGI